MHKTLWSDETDDEMMARNLQSTVLAIENSPAEAKRRDNMLYDMELYLGTPLTNLYDIGLGEYATPTVRGGVAPELTTNLCYSIVNTILNRICSFRPRAQFVPSGGNYKSRRASRNMTSMSDAWSQEINLQREMSLAFRDMLAMCCGAIKTYIEGNKVKAARFPAWEFLIDYTEGLYAEPQHMYHVQLLPLEEVAASYDLDISELRREVVSAPHAISYGTDRSMVRVVEAWKRGPNGLRVICVGNKLVVEPEEWEFDGFPVTLGAFEEPVIGPWGTSAIFPIRSIQVEKNELMTTLREAHRLSSSQVWIVPEEEGSPTKINNDYVRIFRYKNRPPEVTNPAAVNQEIYKYNETLDNDAYKVLGISQFIAAGTKQPGLNSAVAIRESSELQTDRLALLSQAWEYMRVDVATWWWRLTKKLVKDLRSKKSDKRNKENEKESKVERNEVVYRVMRHGAWKEVVFDDLDTEYEIRPFPTSIFGQTISGRLERAIELIQAGWLSKEDAMKALDVPDLEPIIDIQLSESYYMEKLVDDILDDGEYVTPDPYVDAMKFLSYARARYLLALSDEFDYPERHMSECRRLIDYLDQQVQATIAKQQQGQAMAMEQAKMQAAQQMQQKQAQQMQQAQAQNVQAAQPMESAMSAAQGIPGAMPPTGSNGPVQ